MLGQVRPLVKPLLLRIAKPLAGTGISPNAFSVLAVPLAAGAALALVTSHWTIAFFLTGFSGLVDLLDGSIARLQHRETPFGNYLDTMLDRIVEVILYLGLAVVWPLAAATALAFSMLVSYAKARVALVIQTDDRDWPGMGDRADRFVVLLVGMLAASFGFVPGLHIALWIIAGLTIIGMTQRMIYAYKLIESEFHLSGNPAAAPASTRSAE